MQHSETNKENLSKKGLFSSDEKEHATCISKGNATIQNKRTKPCTCPKKKPDRLNENEIGRVWRHIIFFFERLTLYFQ